MKISANDLKHATAMLSLLRFFPSDPVQVVAVGSLLESMCESREQLQWLVQQASRLSEWPGPGELRGMLCTRFRPADGIEHECTLPGFTVAEREMKAITREPIRLTDAEAKKLIAGLTDPNYDIKREIEEQEEMMRKFVKFPETVKGCQQRIAELRRQLRSEAA